MNNRVPTIRTTVDCCANTILYHFTSYYIPTYIQRKNVTRSTKAPNYRELSFSLFQKRSKTSLYLYCIYLCERVYIFSLNLYIDSNSVHFLMLKISLLSETNFTVHLEFC